MKPRPKGEFRLVLHYGDRRIHCEVRRSARRVKPSVAIHVEPTGNVLVDAPLRASDAEIRLAVTRKLGWINKRLVDVEGRMRLLTPREYVSGETVLYLGRRYRLKVVKARSGYGAKLRGGYRTALVADVKGTIFLFAAPKAYGRGHLNPPEPVSTDPTLEAD